MVMAITLDSRPDRMLVIAKDYDYASPNVVIIFALDEFSRGSMTRSRFSYPFEYSKKAKGAIPDSYSSSPTAKFSGCSKHTTIIPQQPTMSNSLATSDPQRLTHNDGSTAVNSQL